MLKHTKLTWWRLNISINAVIGSMLALAFSSKYHWRTASQSSYHVAVNSSLIGLNPHFTIMVIIILHHGAVSLIYHLMFIAGKESLLLLLYNAKEELMLINVTLKRTLQYNLYLTHTHTHTHTTTQLWFYQIYYLPSPLSNLMQSLLTRPTTGLLLFSFFSYTKHCRLMNLNRFL